MTPHSSPFPPLQASSTKALRSDPPRPILRGRRGSFLCIYTLVQPRATASSAGKLRREEAAGGVGVKSPQFSPLRPHVDHQITWFRIDNARVM